MKIMVIGFAISFVLLSSFLYSFADRLPNQTPENQLFSIDTTIDATGIIERENDLHWIIATPSSIPSGEIASVNYTMSHFWARVNNKEYASDIPGKDYLYPKGNVLADTVYSHTILTNGGKLQGNEIFVFDSQNAHSGLYNLETENILTFSSVNGSHLTGQEEYQLDIAGEAKPISDSIRCVFTTSTLWVPPFCNIVTAKSTMQNMNHAQISMKGQMRQVAGKDELPSAFHYQIAVKPDISSGERYAEGSVQTRYAGSITEGRDTGMYLTAKGASVTNNLLHTTTYKTGDPVPWDLFAVNGWRTFSQIFHYPDWLREFFPEIANGLDGPRVYFMPSVENSWEDTSEVTGHISTFQKSFSYESGFRI